MLTITMENKKHIRTCMFMNLSCLAFKKSEKKMSSFFYKYHLQFP